MVEDVPLPIDLADTAMRIAARESAVVAAVPIRNDFAGSVNDYAAPLPGTGRAVAIAVCELTVILAGGLVLKAIAAVDEDVFIANLTYR